MGLSSKSPAQEKIGFQFEFIEEGGASSPLFVVHVLDVCTAWRLQIYGGCVVESFATPVSVYSEQWCDDVMSGSIDAPI